MLKAKTNLKILEVKILIFSVLSNKEKNLIVNNEMRSQLGERQFL